MSFLPIFILGIIQGITEFLPISSSGHLVVAGKFLDFKQQSLLIDVSLHLGTLGAVIVYFSRETKILLMNIHCIFQNKSDEQTLFTRHIITATAPIVIIGGIIFLFGVADIFRNLQIIALATILFGILLYFADVKSNDGIKLKDLTMQKSFLIGIFQILSIIPGTSRAGIVYTGSRFLNLNRVEAARFSMILSIPVIILSSAIPIIQLLKTPTQEHLVLSIIGFIISFIVAYFSIDLLLKWLKSHSMTPFVIYRIILGSILLYITLQ
tara:strand:- start:29 stop:829 length:801 start_codon:yes stop_codon:yes gene_type:complete